MNVWQTRRYLIPTEMIRVNVIHEAMERAGPQRSYSQIGWGAVQGAE